MTMLLKKTTFAKRLQIFIKFCILLFLFISPKYINAQITGIVTTTESICISDGTVKISGANPTSEYALTGASIPQYGPFYPTMGMVLFQNLPKGDFTITEFKADNTEPTQPVTVSSNYEQNWSFTASINYNPCSGGTPTVSIDNFQIVNATGAEQRPPYTFRISSKNGSLPADGSTPPPFQNVSSFSIPYPLGMNGNYELQAKDNCGNYKTINVYVPQTAPSPNLSLTFNNFLNCAGDASYTATASGGTPNYVFTIIAPSTDQVGFTQTTSGTANFNFTTGGYYSIQVVDQCGGITVQTVNVKQYASPYAEVGGADGTCDPLPNGTGAFSLYVAADGLGPYTATITNDCGAPTISQNVIPGIYNPIIGLTRPCNYTIVVTDGCGKSYTLNKVRLIGPMIDSLAASNYHNCPLADDRIIETIYAGYGPPYNPTAPYTFELFDSLMNYLPGYPLPNQSYAIYPLLDAGNYFYRITDACGATSLKIPFNVPLYKSPTVSVEVNNICFGAGQAIVKGINNNPLAPTTYTYSIIAGPTRVGEGPETDSDPNTGKFSSLQSEGVYTFRFNDGCKNIDITVTIPKYSQPTWEVGFGAICPGSTTSNLEVINLQPEGMIVGTYYWRIIDENSDIYTTPLPFPNSTGQSSPIFPNLPPKNGAMDVATYTIQGNDGCKNSYLGQGKVGILPSEDLILDQIHICANGEAIIKARVTTPLAGGTYVYYKDGIEVARSKMLNTFIMNAMPGSYTAKVFPHIETDTTCFSVTPAIIVSGGLEILCSADQQPTCQNPNSGAASVLASNGVEPYTYLWSNGAATTSISGLSAGTYTVTVMDASNCAIHCSVILILPGSPNLTCTNIIQPTCLNPNGGSITPTITGGTMPFTYLWSNGATSPTLSGLIGGMYSLTVTDMNGCTGSCSTTLNTPINCCTLSAALTQPVGCDNAGTFPPTDDKILFTLNVTGSGIGTGYSLSTIPGLVSPSTGTYNTPIFYTMQLGSVGAGDVTVEIVDNVSPNCKFTLVVTDPLICDTGDLCLIDADGLANITCNDASTSSTQADDYTTFTLNPSGLGVSGTYSVTVISGGGNVTPGVAAYGTSTSFHFNNGSATGGAKTIRIQDIGKADCYLDVIVPSAGPCSNCVNPPCVPINVIKN